MSGAITGAITGGMNSNVCFVAGTAVLSSAGLVAIENIQAGDVLVSVNGEYVVVEKIQHEILEAPIAVCNFEVADFHTYYVGTTSVLVHNVCKNPGSYEIFTSSNQVCVGKGSEQRMLSSIKRLTKQGYEYETNRTRY